MREKSGDCVKISEEWKRCPLLFPLRPICDAIFRRFPLTFFSHLSLVVLSVCDSKVRVLVYLMVVVFSTFSVLLVVVRALFVCCVSSWFCDVGPVFRLYICLILL